MKVLVVDDVASNLKLLRVTLEAEGVTVGEAPDGIAALAELEAGEFDAVISDILMPRMDGYCLCREIRRHPRLRHLAVIVYTSTYLSAGDEQLALRSGADRYVRKPAAAGVLFRLLSELLAPPNARLPESPRTDDSRVVQEHNAVLAQKLEAKSRELTERNRELLLVNNELIQNRSRFESIIASAKDAIVTVNETEGILVFNAAAEVMFGTSAAAMFGQPLATLLGGRFGTGRPSAADVKAGARTPGPPPAVFNAISARRVNGAEFPVEASFSIAEVGGRLLCTVILRDISERKRNEELLQLVNEQLRALTARNETIRERERTTIAREIHDVLAQDLTSLKIDLVWIAKRSAKPIDEPTRGVIAARIGDTVAQADAAISTVQRIATELRPVILDSLGLPAAIEWQVEDFGRRTGLTCRTRTPNGDSLLKRECATAVFRILQESLTNIARHASATEVDVEFSQASGFATLVVRDNGCGITPEQVGAPRSIGLVGMRERAQAFGGTVEITGTLGIGTTLRLQIPLEAENASPPP